MFRWFRRRQAPISDPITRDTVLRGRLSAYSMRRKDRELYEQIKHLAVVPALHRWAEVYPDDVEPTLIGKRSQ